MKFRTSLLFMVVAMILISASCQQSGNYSNKVKLETLTDSASYAVGMQFGLNLKQNLDATPGGESMNMDALISGFIASTKGEDSLMTAADADAAIRGYFQGEAEREAQKNLEAGNAFLENNGKRDGVVTTESGLQYEVIKEGNGPKPTAESTVKVHYHGTLIDGTVFDSSRENGEPVTFPVNRVIKGWTEALQLMPVGSTWKLYIPSTLGYGERGSQGRIGPNTTLVFEVELIEIVEK